MKIRLFISYARNDDTPFVERLYADLIAAGFEVWLDRVSMPNRGLAFSKEIADAITSADRFLFIEGPAALASDYVNREWKFALDDACKVIMPILRFGTAHDLPDELALFDAFDFTEDATYDSSLEGLLVKLRDPPPPLARLIGVPDLPPHLIRRRHPLAEIKCALRANFLRPVGITGQGMRVGVYGMGGIGKSVLAKMLAHDAEVRRLFPDGIAWITIGEHTDDRILLSLQQQMLKGLGQPIDFGDVSEGRSRLKEFLADQRALLILDDVWEMGQVQAFSAVGPQCRIILTSRDAGLIHALGGVPYPIELLTEAEAQVFFANWAGAKLETLYPSTNRLVELCGRLPFAIAICGGMIREGARWNDLIALFEEHNLDYMKTDHGVPDYAHRSIRAAIAIGVKALTNSEQDRFAELSVFPQNRATSENAIHTLWSYTGKLSSVDSRKLLNKLNSRSLVMVQALQGDNRTVSLHVLMHDFASALRPDRKALHQSLVDAYSAKCPAGWPSGPDDGYFLQNLGRHLVCSGHAAESADLLVDFGWLQAKTAAGLIYDLQLDYADGERLAGDHPKAALFPLLERALRRYATVINENPQSLLQHLWSICYWHDVPEAAQHYVWADPQDSNDPSLPWNSPGPKLYQLMEEWARFARGRPNASPWLRSTKPTGHALMSPVVLEIPTEYYGSVVAIARDGSRMVTLDDVSGAQVWDTSTGRRIVTLREARNAIAFTADGERIVVGSADNVVRVHDAVTGEQMFCLEGHKQSVTAVACTPDGRWVVSGSADNTVRLWETVNQSEFRRLRCDDQIQGLAIADDGRRVAIASATGKVAIWNPRRRSLILLPARYLSMRPGLVMTSDGNRVAYNSEEGIVSYDALSGTEIARTLGHTNRPTTLAATLDASCVVSGSLDNTIKFWNPTFEKEFAVWKESEPVMCLAITADGRRVVSSTLSPVVRLRRFDPNARTLLLRSYDAPITCIAISGSGERVASGGDGVIRIWDAASGLAIYEVHHSSVFRLYLTYDGKQLATAAYDGTKCIWDLEMVRIVEGPSEDVRIEASVFSRGRDCPQGDATLVMSGDYTAIANGKDLIIYRIERPK